MDTGLFDQANLYCYYHIITPYKHMGLIVVFGPFLRKKEYSRIGPWASNSGIGPWGFARGAYLRGKSAADQKLGDYMVGAVKNPPSADLPIPVSSRK